MSFVGKFTAIGATIAGLIFAPGAMAGPVDPGFIFDSPTMAVLDLRGSLTHDFVENPADSGIFEITDFETGVLYNISQSQTRNFLAVGLGPSNEAEIPDGIIASTVETNGSHSIQLGSGDAVNKSSGFEFGANRAPVPSGSDNATLNPGGFDNPDVGDVPLNVFLPGGDKFDAVQAVASNIGARGNIAITHQDGEFNIQNFTLFGDIGIVCAQSESDCNDGASNTFFNDKNTTIPNDAATFDPTFNVVADGIVLGPAQQLNDGGNGDGVQQNTTIINKVLSELVGVTDSIASVVPTLSATAILDVSSGLFDGSDGEIGAGSTGDGKTLTVELADGLNIIDIVTGGDVDSPNDFLLNNVNLIINGSENAFGIFRFMDHVFEISNSNILAGMGGIGLSNIMFHTRRTENAGNETYNFNNAILNGISFMDTGLGGGVITINNAQGCAQFVNDKINFNDVRFNRCSFALEYEEVPEPSTLPLLLVGLLALRLASRRRTRA